MPLDTLEVLKKARAILATNYCPWVTFDSHGNHCAQGAIIKSVGGDPRIGQRTEDWRDIEALTSTAAKRLYPELKGEQRSRMNAVSIWGPVEDVGLKDIFDSNPTVFVNNQLGQQAILEVFDDAIQHEELKRLCSEVESQHPRLDVTKEDKNETVRSH